MTIFVIKSSVAVVLNRWSFRTHVYFSYHEVVAHICAPKTKTTSSLFIMSSTLNVELNCVSCKNDKNSEEMLV